VWGGADVVPGLLAAPVGREGEGGGTEDISGGAPRSLSWPAAQTRSRREGWEGESGVSFAVAGGGGGGFLGEGGLKERALWRRRGVVGFGRGRERRSGRGLVVVRTRNVVRERKRPAVRWSMAPWGTVVMTTGGVMSRRCRGVVEAVGSRAGALIFLALPRCVYREMDYKITNSNSRI